ncbi:hypothetical protein SPLC1_S231050 [Arthrospira platensis C1]|nr:hypothetical protein SPLC1_S231050 [Arthrospira platensis C1]
MSYPPCLWVESHSNYKSSDLGSVVKWSNHRNRSAWVFFVMNSDCSDGAMYPPSP